MNKRKEKMMRELLLEEFNHVAGGSSTCEKLGTKIQNTATLDGILAGAAVATLLPAAGPLVGAVVAGATIVAGTIIANEVVEACEQHEEQKEKEGG